MYACVLSHSVVSDSMQPHGLYSLQASLLMEFSLPQPGFELASLVSPANKGPLPTKVHLVKAMVFPIVMYGC